MRARLLAVKRAMAVGLLALAASGCGASPGVSAPPGAAREPRVVVVASRTTPTGSLEVELVFDNPTAAPLAYTGYDRDSFDPELGPDRISPAYRRQVHGATWRDDDPGFCGVGLAQQEIEGGEGKRFTVFLDAAHLPARIGVAYRLEDGHQGIAWSTPIAR